MVSEADSDGCVCVCSGLDSKVVRKSIARVLTVMNQKKKEAVREAYADKVRFPTWHLLRVCFRPMNPRMRVCARARTCVCTAGRL